MSLQLPTILSPPTPCTPVPTLTVSPQVRSRSCRSPFPGRLPFWASPSLSRLASASGRIEFIIFLIMDWSFASGCSPPRLSATQFPSATDSQCSVRWGLPPHCWCALSGALAYASRVYFAGDLRGHKREGENGGLQCGIGWEELLVSCPRNKRYFVAIEIGRRWGNVSAGR